MRILFVLFFFLSGLTSFSQLHCVVEPEDTTLCYRDSLALVCTVTGTGPFTYRWQKNQADTLGAVDSILVFPSVDVDDTAVYRCIVSNGTETDTSNDARIRMHPKMKFDTMYRYNELGCPGICKGQFKALVSGGTQFSGETKYIFEWGGGHAQDTIVFGLCPGRYVLTVTDSMNCTLDSAYLIDVLRSPKVDFDIIPRDTIYLTNPNMSVVFNDTAQPYMTNWRWDFGDSAKSVNLNPAYHSYAAVGTYPVRLAFTDQNGCDTTITHDLVVKVAELQIPNVFTPNGDGVNDRFEIKVKDEPDVKDFRILYLGNELVIYDRWGRKVYQKSNYASEDWNGDNLSDGTYYYILKCTGQFGDDIFRGSVTIIGRNSSSSE
jgi:gliding motility-associated-like protein